MIREAIKNRARGNLKIIFRLSASWMHAYNYIIIVIILLYNYNV